jgi:Protein of unknown function (DUF3617)
MQKLIAALLLLSPTLSPANAKEFNMRPGLWEMRTTSDLIKLAPYIPADQLENMQALAKEYGLEMPQIENGAAISTTCVTQQMAAQKTLPQFYQKELGCFSDTAIRNGNHYRVNFSCDSAELKGTGSAEGLITSPQSLSGQTQFSGKAQGATVNEKAEITGKWISSSCESF